MSSPFSRIFQREAQEAIEEQVRGLWFAEVESLDEETGGYILRWLTGNVQEPSAPARVATFMAGNERGAFFMPEPGDEVVVGFEQGNFEKPVILGALWSDDVDPPPPDVDTTSTNNIRAIVTRSGHQLLFDDTSNGGKITIRTPEKNLEVVMDDSAGTITVKVDDSNQIELTSTGVTVKGTQVVLQANDANKITISSAGVDIDGAKIDLN